MALVKIISNLQANRLGQMSDIEAFTKGSLLALSVCSGVVTIGASLLVLQTVLSLSAYVRSSSTLSADLTSAITVPLTKISDSAASLLDKTSGSLSKTIDSYSTDSLLSNIKQ